MEDGQEQGNKGYTRFSSNRQIILQEAGDIEYSESIRILQGVDDHLI